MDSAEIVLFSKTDLLEKMMSLFLRSSYRTAQENPGYEACQKEWTHRSHLYVGGERARYLASNLAWPFISHMTQDNFLKFADSISFS